MILLLIRLFVIASGFPAQAGVILMQYYVVYNETGFPRTGGGDPFFDGLIASVAKFSPHRRG